MSTKTLVGWLSILLFTLTLTMRFTIAGNMDDDFDRLDGRGQSGKRVDVIEWQGNLEIHVYPKGSIAGLAMEYDDSNKDKPVMIIGYRFNNLPQKQLVRRAIMGIPFSKNFYAFRDPSAKDYDKIIVSPQMLLGNYIRFKLDENLTSRYPEGADPSQLNRSVANDHGGPAPSSHSSPQPQKQMTSDEETGTVKPFQF